MLTAKRIIPDLKASSKKDALLQIAEQAAKHAGLTPEEVFDVLFQRERLGTTGVGEGIAIPHGKFNNLKSIYGFFACAKKPIAFDAVDEKPVDLIFTILAPADAGADHLKALAEVSRMLRDPVVCKKLRGATSAEAMFVLLTSRPETSVA